MYNQHPAKMPLTGSVGAGGQNKEADVAMVRNRLVSLGFNWVTAGDKIGTDLVEALRLFYSIVSGHMTVSGDGRVDVNGGNHSWLKQANAPLWQVMPDGGKVWGFENFERASEGDHHDWGTHWLAEFIVASGRKYRDDHLTGHDKAALMSINDASLPRGGSTPDHAGHETGLCCDVRLPRTDGKSGGITHSDPLYDRVATRAMLTACRATTGFSLAFFNDPILIKEGLCAAQPEHDNHFHVQISPPALAAVPGEIS